MPSALGFCTFICFILSIICEVESFISYPPSNTVAEINGEAIFNCSNDVASPPFAWTLSRDGTTSGQIIIASSCVVSSGLQTHYRIEQPGGQATCNLVIFNITMEQAGVYRCIESVTYAALLTVIDPAPNMTHNNTQGVMEGEDVVFTCTLNYNGSVLPASTLTPHFYWKNFAGNNVSSFYDFTPVNNQVISQLSVKANRTDITPYTCHVYLELNPTALTGYASNIPPVDNSVSSSTMTVLYSPGNIRITSTVSAADNCVYECTAEANPQAQYEWLDLNSNSTTTGSIKSIASGGQYRCTAFNIIRNQRYNLTQTVSAVSCYPVVENNMTISGSGCTNGLCYCTGSQPLELTCEVYSLPTPTYQWCWNNLLQIEYFGNQVIRVTYDGTYSCTASNSFSMATVSVGVFNCSVLPSTPPSVVSESTATIATTGSTTAGSSGDNCHVSVAAAIAVGAILFISLALNIMLLIIMIKNMRPKHDPFKRAGTSRTILSPETLDLSNEPPAQATYEELTRSNEIHLQPTYDKLTPKPPAPATYQELTHPDEIHLQPPTYEKLTTKPPSYVDDLS